MKINYLFLILTLLMAACNPSTPKTDEVKLATYTSQEIGWTITIPAGFQLLSKSRVAANEEKGRQAIAGSTKETAATDSLKYLLNFQKNQFNLFSATIDPFKAKKAGAYAADHQLVKKMVFDAYHNQKIKIDTVSGKETFGNRTFNAFYIKIYGPDGLPLMNQNLYSALVNGYDFNVNINYNNEGDHKKLLEAFKNSSFVQ